MMDADDTESEMSADIDREFGTPARAAIMPSITVARVVKAKLSRVRALNGSRSMLDWLLDLVASKPADAKSLFVLPDGSATQGLRYTGDGLVRRHAFHINTLDTARANNDPRVDEIAAARAALDDALASLQQQEHEQLRARKRPIPTDACDSDAAPKARKRAALRKRPAPGPGVGYDDPIAAFIQPELDHAAAHADVHGDSEPPPLMRTATKVSVTYRKRMGAADLSPQLRRLHCRKLVERAGEVFAELASSGRVQLYTFTVELADSDKGGRNFHVQGFAVFMCRGDDELGRNMMKALMFALDYADERVQTHIYVESLAHEDLVDEDFVGMMFAYTLKDKGKDTFVNVHGGSEFDAGKCAQWEAKLAERNANINSLGFRKGNFSTSGESNRVKVDAMNVITLVIGFIRRHGYDRFQASFIRRLSWMLQSGNYELSPSLVIARFAYGCNDLRVEALAQINENPAAAGDLRLVRLILCGSQAQGTTGEFENLTSYALRRVPLFVDTQIEKYDLNDVRALVATGQSPVRFRLPNLIRSSWPELRPAGSAVIVDLHAADETVQHAIAVVLRAVSSCEMGLLPLLWEHGHHCECVDGLLSTGYIQAVLQSRHANYVGLGFPNLSILDVFPYCTPLFAHKVDEARLHYPNDPPLLALSNELDLDTFATSKGCQLHGIVTITEAIALLRERHESVHAHVRAAIVRCVKADGEAHHFALVWTRGR